MIGNYLNQTATLRRAGAVAADGSRTYTDETIRIRFEPSVRQFIGAKGETIISQATIFTSTQMTLDDLIEYDGRSWPIQRIQSRWGFDSLSHYEVWL